MSMWRKTPILVYIVAAVHCSVVIASQVRAGSLIFLRAHTGKHVEVMGISVGAHWDDQGSWQKFVVETRNASGEIHSGDTIFLKSHTGNHIDVQDVDVQARWKDQGVWQSLIAEKQHGGAIRAGDQIFLKAHTGKYMLVEGDAVLCHSSQQDAWSTFTIELAAVETNTISQATSTTTRLTQAESAQEAVSKVFLGYFANWFQWWPQPYAFLPAHIQANKITHINYAFAMVGSKDYVVDGRAAPFEIRHFEDNDVSNWGPPNAGWDQPCADQMSWCQQGLYEQVNNLKAQFPSLKTLISVGGWGMNKPASADADNTNRLRRLDAGWNEYVFSDMVGSAANRAKFIASAIHFCRTWKFDGLDLDWEYPGDVTRGGRLTDKADFSLLLQELRNAFETESVQTGLPVLLLTAAVGVGPATATEAYDVPALNQYLDFINLMTYDMYGGWDATTGIHSQLFAGPGDTFPGVVSGENVPLSGAWAVDWWISKGARPSKLNLGLATYSRSFTLSSATPGQGPGSLATATGAAQPVSQIPGTAAYYEILALIANGAETTFDSQRCGAYLQKGDLWMGFDDESTMRCKAQYIKDKGLLGGFVWDLPEDDFLNGSPLISIFSEALFGGPMTMTTSRATVFSSSTTLSAVATTSGRNPATTSATTTLAQMSSTIWSTTATTATQPVPTQPFCADKQRQGLTAAPANWPGNIDCRGYFNCWNGNEPMLMCVEGAMFDPEINNCQWASLLGWDCETELPSSSLIPLSSSSTTLAISETTIAASSTRTMTTTATTTAAVVAATTTTTPLATQITSTSTSTTSTVTASMTLSATLSIMATTSSQSDSTQPFCADKQRQGLTGAPANWPGNIDCRGYFNCWNGHEPMLLCAEGTMFDSTLRNCQWASLLDWECASQPLSSSTSMLSSSLAAPATSTSGMITSAASSTSATSTVIAKRTVSTSRFLARTTTTTTTTNTAISSCTISGVEDLLTPEIEDFLSRAVVKPGEPQIDLADPAHNEPNVQRIMRVLPESEFDFLFPRANKGSGPGRNGPYSYLHFLKSAWQFPYFCNEPGQTDMNCKEELVAMFAHFAQEVGEQNPNLEAVEGIPIWRQGLYHYEELCAPNCIYRDTCDDSSWQAQKWPCPAGVSYYGRGAKQLTHNYNYGPFSTAMFADPSLLLNDPDRIIRDGWLAFSSAFWFYMTPQPPKPSMHDVVTGRWLPNAHDIAAGRLSGFGVLIMIINGAQECSNGPHQWATNRINFYKSFSNHFGLDVGAHLDCEAMPPFDNDGAAMQNMYWAPSARGGCELQEFVSPCNLLDTPYDLAGSYCQCSACNGEPPVVCPPPEKLVSCSQCDRCVANQCHEQAATDDHCAPCANDGQSWWPCNVEDLCMCAD